LSSLDSNASSVYEVLAPVPESTGAWILRLPFSALFGGGGAGQRKYTIPVRELTAEKPAYNFTAKGRRRAAKFEAKLKEELATMTVEGFLTEHKLAPSAPAAENAPSAES
jgi:hypothetical protein